MDSHLLTGEGHSSENTEERQRWHAGRRENMLNSVSDSSLLSSGFVFFFKYKEL